MLVDGTTPVHLKRAWIILLPLSKPCHFENMMPPSNKRSNLKLMPRVNIPLCKETYALIKSLSHGDAALKHTAVDDAKGEHSLLYL